MILGKDIIGAAAFGSDPKISTVTIPDPGLIEFSGGEILLKNVLYPSAADIVFSSGDIVFIHANPPSVALILQPRSAIHGYHSDGTNITIPIISVAGLTAAEADPVTGDWRKILQSMLSWAVDNHQMWVWSEKPRTYSAFSKDIRTSGTLNRHFTLSFYTDMGAPNVAPEI